MLIPSELPDDQSVHISNEEPIFSIPYTENPLNQYETQIVITESNTTRSEICNSKYMFNKFRHQITLGTTLNDEEAFRNLKPLISLDNVTCLKFSTPSIERKITRILRTSLRHQNTKLLICNRILGYNK